ncbi:pseudouridine synthase [Roseateles amylovorans]|uniref:tRNA pseudouridine synthase C n=1 Tax=Roseateles amylovorans TaxID=2978473 RepID=A0ABY6B2R1_9BURK|nr:pseudouridine synthase [Roseateles amylovorans]UXH79681.1 pseudouridine synthase [Roseateles amylovorans]
MTGQPLPPDAELQPRSTSADRATSPHTDIAVGMHISTEPTDAAHEAPVVHVAPVAPLKLLYLDDALAVIDKPAGLLVHRTALDAHEDDAALQRLRDQLGRPVWPVHRLDRGTSGVLVFALSAEVASQMGVALAERLTHKRYLALVRGWPASAHGVIDHPLARDPELPSAGQPHLEAQTAWSCLHRLTLPVSTDARFPTTRVSVWACEPVQGRRHQIRRHLKHVAHPIIGDANHGKGPLNRALAAHFGLQRLWLHAHRLQFNHPVTGAPLSLEAPPGPEWAGLLAADDQNDPTA